MLSRFKLFIAGVMVVVTSGVVSYAVSAAVPQSLLAAGSTRYAVASVPSVNYITTTSNSFNDVAGLSTSITIPNGKHGDALVFFCGSTFATSTTTWVRALVAGAAASPGRLLLEENNGYDPEGVCANFYKANLTGTGRPMTVKMQWMSNTSGMESYMSGRSMIVIINIH